MDGWSDAEIAEEAVESAEGLFERGEVKVGDDEEPELRREEEYRGRRMGKDRHCALILLGWKGVVSSMAGEYECWV